ncbi:hypothetical protein BV898_17736 [Hypsibius exemplaris]|uniref:Uncharacterized protein n=1 Tax=Hypsibius exemplaris TaxID=2072580 RepID=A0A9X6RN32_HYPEX|nr:hypothetical protein BV898_17736 [Hypsibius exemplaris]
MFCTLLLQELWQEKEGVAETVETVISELESSSLVIIIPIRVGARVRSHGVDSEFYNQCVDFNVEAPGGGSVGKSV